MSTTDIDEVLVPDSPAAEPSHNGDSANGNGVSANGLGRTSNGHHAPVAEEHRSSERAATAQASYVARLELRLAELVEIEKMRDLEIHHLEAELGQIADRAFELETALFHSERRAKDLERRWRELAEVYEAAAAALVIAGGQLEEIQHQAGYRLVLRANTFVRRYPAVYSRLHRRLQRSVTRPSEQPTS